MRILMLVVLGLSALAFIMAVASSLFGGSIIGVYPEAYSRACTNLALIAIGARLIWAKESS